MRTVGVVVLLFVWGCGDKEDKHEEPPLVSPPPSKPRKEPGESPNGSGGDLGNSAIQPDPNNPPQEPQLLYETFPGHELETFKTNTELTNFLLELSTKTDSSDSFGSNRFRPNMNLWDKPSEVVRMGPRGNAKQFLVQLKTKPIYLQGATGVFGMVAPGLGTRKKFVLKYRLECEDWTNLRTPNSVIQEAWFMSQLAPKGMTTPAVYYSDPALNVREVPISGIKKLEKTSCEESRGDKPVIRYMISEKAGRDLHDFLFRKSPGRTEPTFQDKIKIAGQMILYLERLHALNIVHGDAHTGNWIVENGVVKMIDFGRSKIITDSELDANQCRMKPASSHLWNTKWEMRWCPYSYRDDVVQAVFMLGIMLHGYNFQKYVEYLEKHLDEHARMKNGAIYFDYQPSAGFVVDSSVPKSEFSVAELLVGRDDDTVKAVREKLDTLSSLASNDAIAIGEKPDYEGIKKALGAILYAVDGLRSDNFQDWFKLPSHVQ